MHGSIPNLSLARLKLTEAGLMVLRILQDGDIIVFASGCYLDRVLLAGEEGAPQYEERVVVCDSRRFDTQLAIPL